MAIKAHISRAAEADFKPGLRASNLYRDLGVAAATGGRFHAHVLKATEAAENYGRHRHGLDFQMIYILKGSFTVAYGDDPPVTLGPGDAAYQPPGIPHDVLHASADLELLEIVSPAEFTTEEVQAAS